MPRNGSGVFSLSGANFPAVPATLIEATKYNANLNDIGAALTQSVSADGQTTITNNLPLNNNKLTGLAQATAAGDAVRYNQLQKGSDIAVSASGTVAIPSEGSLFNLTAAAAFNVTGFTGGYDGRTFGVRFNPDKLLTLVNSASFKLLGGTSRITRAGEIIYFCQEAAGVIAEIGQQPVLDLTGYSGADIALGIGQSAIYTVTAATTLLLRIAVASNQEYKLTIIGENTPIAGVGTQAQLQPNNTTFTGQFLNAIGQQNNTTISGNTTVINSFVLDGGFKLGMITASIGYRGTSAKMCQSLFTSYGSTATLSGWYNTTWNDTTTWTSLGTLLFNSLTATVRVKREL